MHRGGIAQAITAVPGSSQWFEYGFVTYANQAKQQLLGVEDHVLQHQGAVSQPVVEQVALVLSMPLTLIMRLQSVALQGLMGHSRNL